MGNSLALDIGAGKASDSPAAAGSEGKASSSAPSSASRKRILEDEDRVLLSPKRAKTSRRKSTGRKERRSIVPEPDDEEDETAFHKDISSSKPESDRFLSLLRTCMEHGVQQTASAAHESGLSNYETNAKAALDLFMETVEKDGGHRGAVQKPVLKPNPKNTEMRKNLRAYEELRDALMAEEKQWTETLQQLQAALKTLEEKAAEVADNPESLLTDAQQKLAKYDQAKEQEEDVQWAAKAQIQVARLKEACETFERVAEWSGNMVSQYQQQLGKATFSQSSSADAASLIRNVAKASQSSTSSS